MKKSSLSVLTVVTFLVVGIVLILWLIHLRNERNAEIVRDCEHQHGVVAWNDRGDDFCIRDGLIIKVYH